MKSLTEFDNDLIKLAKIVRAKDSKQFRQKLLRMFDKMQMSNTKDFYKDKINRLCLSITGETYERLFLIGIPTKVMET